MCGLETTLGENHLGHFLLTNLLLPTLKKSAPSRVVTVSHKLHHFARMELDDLNLKLERSYTPQLAYYNSQLANILFTRALARRLRQANAGVTANCLHPGLLIPDIYFGLPRIPLWILKALLNIYSRV